MLLTAFLRYKQAKLREEAFCASTVFAEGWNTPRRPPTMVPPPGEAYCTWDEVQTFLVMAEQALKARSRENTRLCQELESARSEKCQVERTSSLAQEESSFLAEHLRSLADERASLRDALEAAQREGDHLRKENSLLREEVLEESALGEEGSAALQLLARTLEELRVLQARNAQLENENVQLLARVSALERASTAQATALMSCLEESERVRLQQLSVCESPVGPLAARLQRSEFTDDSSAGVGGCGCGGGASYADEVAGGGDDASEACGFSGCATPCRARGASGRYDRPGALDGASTVFHSLECSPEQPQKQQQRQQQQQQQQQLAQVGQQLRLLQVGPCPSCGPTAADSVSSAGSRRP